MDRRGVEVMLSDALLERLRCPASGEPLRREGDELVSASGKHRYPVYGGRIPLFAEAPESEAAARQQAHYDAIAGAYIENLDYPHTRAYQEEMDRIFLGEVGPGCLGDAAELCCGRGEALGLLEDRIDTGIGVDISLSMLEAAAARLPRRFDLVQGDATRLPLADASLDSVLMVGGIHHVPDRAGLFGEVARILRPGGRFLWREPVSDFWLWRALRAVVYRVSPTLDADHERPLLYRETAPVLESAGLALRTWRTLGFLGFCVLMNSDVLVLNRVFRFVPGIRTLARAAARFDDLCVRLPGMGRCGVQLVGEAVAPASSRPPTASGPPEARS
jgi:SAM-dependent methyltransferase